jgi:hypothetical protein
MISVGLLSRLHNPNIGHTLMHVGIERVVRSVSTEPVEFVHLEQHEPMRSLFGDRHFLSLIDQLPDWPPHRAAVARPIKNLFLREPLRSWSMRHVLSDLSDLTAAIAVGGPNLISGMSLSSQIKMMMLYLHDGLGRAGVPVLNLSVGSCLPFGSEAKLSCPTDVEMVKQALDLCALTTVRDPQAQLLLRSYGYEVPMVPCPVFLSLDDAARSLDDRRGRIIINFMDRWPLSEAHQIDRVDADPTQWRSAVQRVIQMYSNRYEIVFSCHNRLEIELARGIDPVARIEVPTTADDYRRLAEGAVVYLAGRIHCALPLAGAGVPGLVVGTDTRMNSCAAVGISVRHVEAATPEFVTNEIDRLIAERQNERERLLHLKHEVFGSYAELIRPYLRRQGSQRLPAANAR